MRRTESVREQEARAKEQRRHVRKHVLWAARLETKDGPFPCIILNVSRSGAKLRLTAPNLQQQPVKLVMETYGSLSAEIVWQNGDKMGIRFVADPEQVAKILGDALSL
jgi:PilZ domain-containing protein